MENVMDKDKKEKVTVLERIRRKTLVHDTRGLNTVEYAILLVLIVFISFGLWQSFGKSISSGVKKADDEIKLDKAKAVKNASWP